MGSSLSDAKEIVGQALEIEAESDRIAYIDHACAGNEALRAEIDSLLALYKKAAGFLEKSPVEIPPTVIPPAITEGPGTVIGDYRLLEQIGEGGFGVVFMAEQTHPVRRKVALKVIKPGMDTRQVIARFEAERQALAVMDHPNIAKVYDGGTTESGRPYFVMELVKGVPITKYCDEHNLSTPERLELFVRVCHAVQHAHQKGIIHRDLKPTNVMVAMYDDRAVPKVIDFGVAKATGQVLTDRTMFTQFGQIVGTLEYMSPEQAQLNQLDVDTRSDVYSLGVLLYELLTGATPLCRHRIAAAALDEMLRIIREEDPPRPSTRLSSAEDLPSFAAQRNTEPRKLTTSLRGELDWIVMKALEKDRTRRYETANGLAMDIQRYLSDEAVLACPPSTIYRLRKFVRRNRVVFAVSGVLTASLIVGSIVSTWQAIRAIQARRLESEQRRLAEQERDEKTRHLYAAQMNAAARAWDDRTAGRALELLEFQTPERTGHVDLRGWEWQHLWRLTHTEHHQAQALALFLIFADDGSLLTTGWDGAICIHSPDGLRSVRKIPAHQGRIANFDYSSSGMRAATAGMDGTVKLWDTSNWQLLRTFPGWNRVRYPMSLSRDGKQIAIATDAIHVYTTDDGKEIARLDAFVERARRMQFLSDGKRLITHSSPDERGMTLWDLETGQVVRNYEKHRSAICTFSLSANDRLLVSGATDGEIIAWEPETGNQMFRTKEHVGAVKGLALSPDMQRLASSSDDTTVKLWNVATGELIRTFRGHSDGVAGVAFLPDGQTIVSNGWDSTLRYWDASSRQEPWTRQRRPPLYITATDYSRDNRYLAAGGNAFTQLCDASSGVVLWDVNEDENLSQSDRRHSKTLKLDPRGRFIVAGFHNGRIRLRDLQSGRLLRSWHAHGGGLTSLDVSFDGEILATAGRDHQIRLWNTETGQLVKSLPGTGHPDQKLFFSPDGRFLLSFTSVEQSELKMWDVSTGQILRSRFVSEGIDPICAAFSPDGLQIVMGGRSELLYWFDAFSLEQQHQNRAHTGSTFGLSFSLDGRRLASCGGTNHTVKIWDVQTHSELQTLNVEDPFVYDVLFSSDGTRLVAASSSGRLTVWDARPLTPELRAEIVAADIVEKTIASGASDDEVIRQVREKPAVCDDVRRKALELADTVLTSRRAYKLAQKVDALFRERHTQKDVVAALQADTTLSDSDCRQAIQWAQERTDE